MGKKGLRELNIPTRIILIAYSVIVLYPLFWTIITSFKTTEELYKSPWALPSAFKFDNYANALEKANIGLYFLNSVLVTVVSLVITVAVSYAAAYVLARYNFRFNSWLKKLYFGGLFIPAAFNVVPLFTLLNDIHLLDSLLGLSLTYAAKTIPYTIYLLIGFLISIPKEYEEAGSIDGYSILQKKITSGISMGGLKG